MTERPPDPVMGKWRTKDGPVDPCELCGQGSSYSGVQWHQPGCFNIKPGDRVVRG